MQLIALCSLVGEIFLAAGFLGLFFLLFLQLLDELVDNLVALVFGHVGKAQQRVLQVDVLRVDGQLVEHVAATLYIVVVGECLRQQGHGLGVVGLCLLVVAALEV